MQDDKRDYTPPELVPMGTVRSLTRTTDVIGSLGTEDLGDFADDPEEID